MENEIKNLPQAEVIIGIDLGTTNSEVCVIHNGKPKVLKIDGNQIMPSVISADAEGQILVGRAALNNLIAAPLDTVCTIKRKMGQDEIYTIAGKQFSPPMISSLILKRLKLAAEEFLQLPVSKAIITVPAFFNEQQREATKEAADLAGLEAIRLLNEPTSAALAYSMGKNKQECCLIYDLGGGTFDVSIVYISPSVMEVKASHGDVELGGSDFDREISEKARQDFLNQYGVDLLDNPSAAARLMRAAEQAKIRLSTEAEAELLEEYIAIDKNGSPLHLKFKITRTEFESLIKPAIQRTLESVRLAMDMAEISLEKIDRVILVGGATYTPLVSQMLTQELNIVPQSWIDPSLVVAIGAAVEAANLAGQPLGPTMVDVTPHSLGTGCLNEYNYLYNEILIPRNTPLPATASRVFYKTYEDQEEILIKAYQGESQEISANKFLGEFRLDGLSDSKDRDIHIKYHLDRSGLLHVTATDISSGKKADHTFKRVSASRVQRADLSQLSNVKIKIEPQLEALEEEEDSQFWSALEEETVTTPAEEGIQIFSPQNEELFTRSQLLLESDKLHATDKEELLAALELAKNRDEDAIKRLSELIYFLE